MSKTDQETVSQILLSIDKDGKQVLGFTVNTGEYSFYNVMRYFSKEDYAQVYHELAEERRHIQDKNKKSRRKKWRKPASSVYLR